MHVVVTRPAQDARPLAEKLRRRGVHVTIEPMMKIEPSGRGDIDLEGVQALLFTSSNGIRAFAEQSRERALPVFTTGPTSAERAAELGFANVEAAAGNVESLAALVAKQLTPSSGTLFHGAGADRAGDLDGALSAHGFEVRREVLYEAKPVAEISRGLAADMNDAGVTGILFYSPRTVRIFQSLVAGSSLMDACHDIDAYCLSRNVAEAAAEIGFLKVLTAQEPSERAMLSLIGIDHSA